jgi:uncharacterized protein (DUF2235 family)
LITHSGIPGKASDVELAWQLYLKHDAHSAEELKKSGRLFDIPVEVLGVWDTVKTTNDEDFNDNKLPKCVVAGYHAMAIDEKRKLFPVLKWNNESRVKQTWFSGVHSDIGGGYSECSLSDISLLWMIDNAYKHGLKFKASEVNKCKPNPQGTVHDSFGGIWEALGTKVRTIPKMASIHVSTKEHVRKVASYKPTNLPAEPNYVK